MSFAAILPTWMHSLPLDMFMFLAVCMAMAQLPADPKEREMLRLASLLLVGIMAAFGAWET